jgi:hypothetical protein
LLRENRTVGGASYLEFALALAQRLSLGEFVAESLEHEFVFVEALDLFPRDFALELVDGTQADLLVRECGSEILVGADLLLDVRLLVEDVLQLETRAVERRLGRRGRLPGVLRALQHLAVRRLEVEEEKGRLGRDRLEVRVARGGVAEARGNLAHARHHRHQRVKVRAGERGRHRAIESAPIPSAGRSGHARRTARGNR